MRTGLLFVGLFFTVAFIAYLVFCTVELWAERGKFTTEPIPEEKCYREGWRMPCEELDRESRDR